MKPWQGYDLIEAGVAGLCGPRTPVDGQPNRLLSYADPDSGVVYVIGRGLWNEAIVDQHFNELARTAAFIRRRTATVRVLVDLRGAVVQPLAIARQIRLRTRAIWTDQDRIAVVVGTMPTPPPTDQPPGPANQATFGGMADARAWLGLEPQSTNGAAAPATPADRANAAAR